MKPIQPFKPARSGYFEQTTMMDMCSKKRAKEGDGEDDEEMEKRKEKAKKSIFERENILRKPYEKD
jgi:hypothetical protein